MKRKCRNDLIIPNATDKITVLDLKRHVSIANGRSKRNPLPLENIEILGYTSGPTNTNASENSQSSEDTVEVSNSVESEDVLNDTVEIVEAGVYRVVEKLIDFNDVRLKNGIKAAIAGEVL